MQPNVDTMIRQNSTFLSLKRLLIALLACLFLGLYGFAQTGNLYFEHFTTNHGLTNDRVNCVLKDSKGFIWIGTDFGLCRFDGYEFKTFRNSKSDTCSISNNSITALCEDNSNNLWIGTINGLNRYNIKTAKFTRYLHNPTNPKSIDQGGINCIFKDSDNKLWIGTTSLNLFNYETNTFSRTLLGKSINSITEDKQKQLWVIVANDTGIICFNRNNNSYVKWLANNSQTNSDDNLSYLKVYLSKEGLIILGKDNGLQIFDPAKNVFIRILRTQDGISGVRDITQDNNGVYWVGTTTGLLQYDLSNNTFTKVKNNPLDPSSINSHQIQSLYKDNTNIIWVGTLNEGLNVYNPELISFPNLIPDINNHPDRTNRSVKSIYQDTEGFYWIGTDYGLNKLDAGFRLITSYVHESLNPNSLNIGGVKSIIEKSKDELWIGNWGGGLQLFNKKSGRFTRLPGSLTESTDRHLLAGDCVMSMMHDTEGNLWIGLIGKGIVDKYDAKTGEYDHFSLNSWYVHQMLYDTKRNLVWCATEDGFFSINPKTKEIKRHRGLSSDFTTSLLFTKSGTLWIGTTEGLNHFDPDKNKFTVFGSNDGFESQYILALEMDNSENLWISTDRGITKFVPSVGKVFNYSSSYGVLINAAYSFKDNKGMLFFGGTNGINAFNPGLIKQNKTPPHVLITGFKLFNNLIGPGDNSVLTQTIETTETIKLNYNQNVFSFDFTALNYSHANRNQYAYKLEGFDKDWHYIGHQRNANYNNVPPGKYIFSVKASNSDGVWNETGKSIRVIIVPPFWKTWWFKLLIGISLITSIVMWIQLRTNSLKWQKERLEKKVEERTLQLKQKQEQILDKNLLLERQKEEIIAQKDLVQDYAEKLHEQDLNRIRFLINISHEFRTPLTLIISPIERLLTRKIAEEQLFTQLDHIYKNAKRILRLVNQLLDIRKIETGTMKLEVSESDIILFIKGIFESFSLIAGQHQIEYSFNSNPESMIAWFDRDKVEKIFLNLLSNAFKFTADGGQITVSIDLIHDAMQNLKGSTRETNNAGNSLIITIKDNGAGIEAEKINLIFDRFYQADSSKHRMTEGTGIGLNLTKDLVELHHGKITVQSEFGRGATFIVELPVSKDQFNEDELILNTHADCFSFSEELVFNNIMDPIHEKESAMNSSVSPLVLVVEDNADLRNFIHENLNGYRVIEAADGKEGLNIALSEIPDLVISDIMMPNMNGLELCKMLKSDERTSHIPVILLTARSGDESQIEGLTVGADDYVVKPFHTEVLLARVANVIENNHRLQQRYSQAFRLEPSNTILQGPDAKLFKKISILLDENLSDPDFNVDILSERIGMSRVQLYRKFKGILNETPADFIKGYKLKRAIQLLGQKQYNVSEIAYMLGFHSHSHFSKVFKAEFGKTPSEMISR
jgi:signal transduction histidine kinase/ligand-binding sensor domain-containing protein/DNA-binding response OmpR family regulator